ncbi:MAG: c-type cytochrome [Sphingomonadales bacterium]|nr:c-type cytochrome [Sphingomonadales bacterium]
MRLLTATATTFALALTLSACGQPAEENAAEPAAPAVTTGSPAATTAATTTAATDGKPAAFAQCAACHAVEAGKNGVGPSLAGVFGKKAGGVAGFAYSDANKNSGLTWDEATLDTYLTNPMKMVPGTKMTFAGLADPAQRKAVIDYLKTLK